MAQGAWNTTGQLGCGGAIPCEIARVRELAPTLPLLIPGVGAQGGDAQATVQAGWGPEAPIMVSSSRAVLYASSGSDFASAARAVALQTRAALNAARSSCAPRKNVGAGPR